MLLERSKQGSQRLTYSGTASNMAIDLAENKARMLRGELYHAFVPDLTQERARCAAACTRYNNAGDASRREKVRLMRE